jgi:hypothetical protein
MEISNIKKFAQLRKNNVLFNIFFVGLIITFSIIENFDKYRIFVIVVIASIYVLLLVYFIMLNYTYFSIKDAGSKIIVKHYKLFPIARKYVSYEIAKINFAGFEIKNSFFNKREDLYLFTKINNKKASYPPISLSALTKEDKSNLIKFLKNQL